MDTLRSDIDWSRFGLFGVGLFMVAAGVATEHVAKQAVIPLIGAGALLTASALVFPRLRSVDFGVFKMELGPDQAASRSPRTDAWRLQRFAWLVCGDAANARDLVEEALAETRSSRLSADGRGINTLKSLVALLENAREHAWLRPSPATHKPHVPLADDVASEEARPTMEALAKLPVGVRMAYLLRCSWLLPLDEVVKIVAQTPDEVSEAVVRGREAMQATL